MVKPGTSSGTARTRPPSALDREPELTMDRRSDLANSWSATAGPVRFSAINALTVATRCRVAASTLPKPNARMFGRRDQLESVTCWYGFCQFLSVGRPSDRQNTAGRYTWSPLAFSRPTSLVMVSYRVLNAAP